MALFSTIFTLWGVTKLALLFAATCITLFLMVMCWVHYAAQSAGNGVLYSNVNGWFICLSLYFSLMGVEN